MTERLGIVYTPVEVVDFIIKSVDDVLKEEFGQTLGSKGVHIIDPFVGTGTFITRLLQSGLIKPEELQHKYKNEIHANEIVLLAYYIAAINIEAVYHSVSAGDKAPFEGICLTDTFQLYEQDHDMIADLMPDNSERRTKQKALDIRVIVGNPPYSSGQNSANDNAANLEYPNLDARIAETYADRSTATNKNAIYDSYIRAIRWGSDRLKGRGVLGFVTNAGWVDGNAMDGVRKCLTDDFSNLYVFHLRGNQRTSGERSRKEGGKIFGSGSRSPIAISILVKNPDAKAHGQIHFLDIGDYLTREDKLAKVAGLGSISGITSKDLWTSIQPDEYGDWLNQRDRNFEKYMVMGDKKDKSAVTLFETYSAGVKTARDAWCFNPSRSALEAKMIAMIDFYNAEVERYLQNGNGKDVGTFINSDATKISWNRAFKADLKRGRKYKFEPNSIVKSVYRPFQSSWLCFSRQLNDMIYQVPRLFPHPEAKNRVIVVKQRAPEGSQFVLMVDRIMELQSDGGTQCFPLKVYDSVEAANDFFSEQYDTQEMEGVTDAGLAYFQLAYPAEQISKEDIFYYTYGILHSEEYRERYADNMAKELPRIPCVKTAGAFWRFVVAGRKLGDLHVAYESVDPFPVTIKQGSLDLSVIDDPEAFYRVEKMKFAGKRPNLDKSTVIYNPKITMQNIPLEAYDYIVNGKPAIEWVMERQAVTKDKASGIINDANRYAIETMNDPAYPLKLFQRVITVSLETMKIVRGLPKLDLQEPKA